MAISEVLNIPPWDQEERLTVEQLLAAIAYIEELKKQTKR